MNPVKDKLNIEMNFSNPGDHVPEAEQNIRKIKERIRATFHRLPYKSIPRIMVRYLVMDCTHKINMFPAKGDISHYYSPRIILGQRALDYKKECTIPFRTYVQAQTNPKQTNSNAPRTLDAIYLCPAQNIQGGHEVMDLATGHVITCGRVIEVPITKTIIEVVENMGYEQGFKKGLKFTNRSGTIFPDNDWIAGVENDERQDESENNENIENETENETENQNNENENEKEPGMDDL